MDPKQAEIVCPCCNSRLLIDLRSGRMVRSRRPEELDAEGKPKVNDTDWDEATGRVRSRESTGEERLDSALERERSRSSRLDDLFKQANDKLREEE